MSIVRSKRTAIIKRYLNTGHHGVPGPDCSFASEPARSGHGVPSQSHLNDGAPKRPAHSCSSVLPHSDESTGHMRLYEKAPKYRNTSTHRFSHDTFYSRFDISIFII